MTDFDVVEIGKVVWRENKPTYQELEAENERLREWFNNRRQPDYETLKKALEEAIKEINLRREISNLNFGIKVLEIHTPASWIERCKSQGILTDGHGLSQTNTDTGRRSI